MPGNPCQKWSKHRICRPTSQLLSIKHHVNVQSASMIVIQDQLFQPVNLLRRSLGKKRSIGQLEDFFK